MSRFKFTPKADFLADKARASAHQDVVLSPQFREAAKTALLHYSSVLDKTDGKSILLLKGAEDFLNVLLNLGEALPPTEIPQEEYLNPIN